MTRSVAYHRLTLVMMIVIILIGGLLRASGLFTELWFDEICSIDYVQSTHWAWQAMWSIHTDNKHHLIWLWIWLVGANQPAWMYRLPSLLAGVALLPVVYRATIVAARSWSFCWRASVPR